jgi:hypothetical protein
MIPGDPSAPLPTLSEAARMLGLSRRSLRRSIQRGRIQAQVVPDLARRVEEDGRRWRELVSRSENERSRLQERLVEALREHGQLQRRAGQEAQDWGERLRAEVQRRKAGEELLESFLVALSASRRREGRILLSGLLFCLGLFGLAFLRDQARRGEREEVRTALADSREQARQTAVRLRQAGGMLERAAVEKAELARSLAELGRERDRLAGELERERARSEAASLAREVLRFLGAPSVSAAPAGSRGRTSRGGPAGPGG